MSRPHHAAVFVCLLFSPKLSARFATAALFFLVTLWASGSESRGDFRACSTSGKLSKTRNTETLCEFRYGALCLLVTGQWGSESRGDFRACSTSRKLRNDVETPKLSASFATERYRLL